MEGKKMRNKSWWNPPGKLPDSELACRASLVAQGWRICLPMQEARVQSLMQEDPTCCRATKPVCAPQLLSVRSRAHELQLRSPCTLEPALHTPRGHGSEKPAHQRLSTAKIKKENLKATMVTKLACSQLGVLFRLMECLGPLS